MDSFIISNFRIVGSNDLGSSLFYAIAAIVSYMLIIKWSLAILQDPFSILLDIDSTNKGRNYGVPNGHYHH